jgi:hypothetical protein
MSAGGVPEERSDPRARARADLVWYLRHADALARWPVLPEEWARRVETVRRGDGPGGDGRRREDAPPGRG